MDGNILLTTIYLYSSFILDMLRKERSMAGS